MSGASFGLVLASIGASLELVLVSFGASLKLVLVGLDFGYVLVLSTALSVLFFGAKGRLKMNSKH